jgi:hypothetical protein
MKLGQRVLDWHNAAMIAGEYFGTNGPVGYYDFTPDAWLTWMRARAAEQNALQHPNSQHLQSILAINRAIEMVLSDPPKDAGDLVRALEVAREKLL